MSAVSPAESSPGLELAKALESSKAPAISRAAAILRLLGKSDTPLSLQVIANQLGLVPSTCLYLLRALVIEELVAVDAATFASSDLAVATARAGGFVARARAAIPRRTVFAAAFFSTSSRRHRRGGAAPCAALSPDHTCSAGGARRWSRPCRTLSPRVVFCRRPLRARRCPP